MAVFVGKPLRSNSRWDTIAKRFYNAFHLGKENKMSEKRGKKEADVAGEDLGKKEASGQAVERGALSADALEVEDVFENAEPWDPIETKIVIGSFAAAVFFLALFGYLINKYILG
jgi:hypothetical protein